MKAKPTPLACLLLALLTPLLSHAELKLPQSQDDYRQLTQKADGGPCSQCGVITDVRSASRQPGERASTATTPAAGIGSSIAPTAIIGSGNSVRDARQASQPDTFYQLTVRYADGSYAVFEQDEQPSVGKGDAVEIVAGRVVRRAAD